MLSRHPERDAKGKWVLQCTLDVIAILFQVSGLFLWPLFSAETSPRPWLQPLSAFLISCGWWENYVDVNSPFGLSKLCQARNVPYTLRIWYNLVEIYSSSHGKGSQESGHQKDDPLFRLYFHITLQNTRILLLHDVCCKFTRVCLVQCHLMKLNCRCGLLEEMSTTCFLKSPKDFLLIRSTLPRWDDSNTGLLIQFVVCNYLNWVWIRFAHRK